jgi:hypothetical protein
VITTVDEENATAKISRLMYRHRPHYDLLVEPCAADIVIVFTHVLLL